METNLEIKADAVNLVKAFDAGELEWTGYARKAAELAEFWIESQFARTDIDCDWSEAKCLRMMARMEAELKQLGLK